MKLKDPHISTLIVIWAATMALCSFGLRQLNLSDYISGHYVGISSVLFIVYLVNYLIMEKFRKKRAVLFVNSFLASTMIKLLLFSGILVTYSLIVKEGAAILIVNFLAMYFIYSLHEIISISRKLKKNRAPVK
ncbi:MAG: hypothetical protein ACEPOV_11705 [Hyphomicrobiales bacterium]